MKCQRVSRLVDWSSRCILNAAAERFGRDGVVGSVLEIMNFHCNAMVVERNVSVGTNIFQVDDSDNVAEDST